VLIWLTFQIKPGFCDCLMGKTYGIAYGADRMAIAQQDRQLRRQLADFETDLKVVQEAGWQIKIETGPAWLTVIMALKTYRLLE